MKITLYILISAILLSFLASCTKEDPSETISGTRAVTALSDSTTAICVDIDTTWNGDKHVYF